MIIFIELTLFYFKHSIQRTTDYHLFQRLGLPVHELYWSSPTVKYQKEPLKSFRRPAKKGELLWG